MINNNSIKNEIDSLRDEIYEKMEHMSPTEKVVYLQLKIADLKILKEIYEKAENMLPDEQIPYLRQKAVDIVIESMKTMSPDEKKAHLHRIAENLNNIKVPRRSCIQRFRESVHSFFSSLLSRGKK